MDRREFLTAGAACAAAAVVAPGLVFAEGGETVKLPMPDLNGGKPLMACLAERRSVHAPGRKDVGLEDLGALLWAAWGVNREDGKHVAPTAINKQQLIVFAVRGDGVWEYVPAGHAMKKVLDGDRRGAFDKSGLILLYAAPVDDRFSGMHVGSLYQNVGLFCASAGMKSCVKYQKHDALDKELPLPKGWATFVTHSIGPRK